MLTKTSISLLYGISIENWFMNIDKL